MRKTLEERFWTKVDKNGPTMPGMESNCWVWTGAVTSTGYGALNGRPLKTTGVLKSHRAAALFSGMSLGPQDWVLHKCDNRLCCRPDHLFVGDHCENMRDMAKKDRAGPTVHPERYRGNHNGRARFNADSVRAIRRRRDDGESLGSIAREFGVRESTICAITKRRNWSWVP